MNNLQKQKDDIIRIYEPFDFNKCLKKVIKAIRKNVAEKLPEKFELIFACINIFFIRQVLKNNTIKYFSTNYNYSLLDPTKDDNSMLVYAIIIKDNIPEFSRNIANGDIKRLIAEFIANGDGHLAEELLQFIYPETTLINNNTNYVIILKAVLDSLKPVDSFDFHFIGEKLKELFGRQEDHIDIDNFIFNIMKKKEEGTIIIPSESQLFLSLQRQEQELKNIAELIKKGQTTPQEYVNNILNKPEFLTNLKRLAMEHPAIFNEMNKLGVIGLLKGDVSAEQYKQISNIKEEVRPYIIDGKYKLNTNKIILKKIDSIKRKKY